MQFEFESADTPNLNRAWVEELTTAANASTGLRLLPEPPDPEQR
jgi:hypothetical protein